MKALIQIISIIILLVSFLSLCLFIIGLLSYRKKKDIRLLSITLAFGTFFIKNLITAISYQFNLIPHGDLELFDASFDLVAMLLLVIPVFKKQDSSS